MSINLLDRYFEYLLFAPPGVRVSGPILRLVYRVFFSFISPVFFSPTFFMAHTFTKPDPLLFDADLSERWRIFERDINVHTRAAHRGAPHDLIAAVLFNVAGSEAIQRAGRFSYAPVVLDDNNAEITPAESINDPVCLMNKFRQLCELRTNKVMECNTFFQRNQLPGEPGEVYISTIKHTCQSVPFWGSVR